MNKDILLLLFTQLQGIIPTMDNQRNKLERQAKHPRYDLICFSLELCNFTLNILQGLWPHILNKNDNVYASIDFSIPFWVQQS